jgi:hypothetical protein
MTDIPITYVPARNTVFLALALAWAETLEAEDIFFGANLDRLLWVPGLPAGVHPGVRADGEPRDQGWRGGQEPLPRPHAAHQGVMMPGVSASTEGAQET